MITTRFAALSRDDPKHRKSGRVTDCVPLKKPFNRMNSWFRSLIHKYKRNVVKGAYYAEMIENEKRGERTVTVDQGASNCHAISETASMSIRPIRPISGLEQNQTRGNNVVITACGEPATSGCTIAVPSR